MYCIMDLTRGEQSVSLHTSPVAQTLGRCHINLYLQYS